MKYLLTILFLLPCFVFSQKADESYAIYSQYLKRYQTKKGVKVRLVIKESLDYSSKYDEASLLSVVKDIKDYSDGKQSALLSFGLLPDGYAETLKKDTLWIPLIAELDKKLSDNSNIKNEFAPELETVVIGKREYNKYHNTEINKSYKSIQQGWDTFHHKYGKAALIGLSEIVSDGKRAVFYFTSNYGGLGGEGGLVLFYKENSKWRFLMYLRIWQA